MFDNLSNLNNSTAMADDKSAAENAENTVSEKAMNFVIYGHLELLCFVALFAALLLLVSGCGSKKAEYTITAEGVVSESGVIEFAGLEMNVYKDKASNPCGDCPDQPVSIYVGATAEEAINAMAEAVERADDIWQVSSCSGAKLVLIEKNTGTVNEEPKLSAPNDLNLKGSMKYVKERSSDISAAGSSVSHDSAESGDSNSENNGNSVRQVTNIDGTVISVPDKAENIAAVYGPSYEAAVILGAEDRIAVCADVQFENFPWALKIFKKMKDLPHLDNVHSSVNFEELQKYDPDLVLTFNRPNELKQLKNAGIAAVNAVTPETLEESVDFLDVYAKAIGGGAQERADAYRKYFNEKIEMVRSVTDKFEDSEKPTVYYAGVDILTTYGKHSDICDVIETAGGRCVTKELNAGNHTQINFEQLAAWDPEYIFIDHGGMNDRSTVEDIKQSTVKDSRYAAIKAVKNGNIYLTPSGTFYWDMGLQKILLVMYMAKELHPDSFESLDMNAEVREFYHEFFGYDLSEADAERILNREDPL